MEGSGPGSDSAIEGSGLGSTGSSRLLVVIVMRGGGGHDGGLGLGDDLPCLVDHGVSVVHLLFRSVVSRPCGSLRGGPARQEAGLPTGESSNEHMSFSYVRSIKMTVCAFRSEMLQWREF